MLLVKEMQLPKAWKLQLIKWKPLSESWQVLKQVMGGTSPIAVSQSG